MLLINSISTGPDTPQATAGVPLWQSPPLGQFPYETSLGGCHNSTACYSPPIAVEIGGLHVVNRAPLWLRLCFQNNDKNLEIDTEDLELEVFWGSG